MVPVDWEEQRQVFGFKRTYGPLKCGALPNACSFRLLDSQRLLAVNECDLATLLPLFSRLPGNSVAPLRHAG
jgi:hypothetical protein